MNTSIKNEKLFGKWNELILLTISFIMTVIVEGIISLMIQNRTWDHQNLEKIKTEEIGNAQKVFEEVSTAIDSRMYLTKRLLWGYTTKKNKEVIKERFNKYDEIIYDWNLNLNRRMSLINRYFGWDLRNIFERDVHDKFRIISSKLDYLIRINSRSINEYTKILEELDQIADNMYGYNVTLLARIKKERIGKLVE